MQVRSFETLVRIFQVGSFSRAAELQNMTLPALSLQMKALEAELGVALFDRSYRPPKLTPLGRLVAQRAKAVIREHQEITAICGAEDALTGAFEIGFIQSASVRILPRFLDVARDQAPNAQFRFRTGLSEDLTEKVALGQIDAAVVTRVDTARPGLQHDLIASERMCYAVPVAFADADAETLSRALPFIHFMPSTGIGKLIADSFRKTGSYPQRSLILDSTEACMACVKTGLGYTILPLPDIERYSDARVTLSGVALTDIRRDLVLVSRPHGPDDPWRRALYGLLMQAREEA